LLSVELFIVMLSVAILGAIEPRKMAVILPIITTQHAECYLC